MRHSFPDHRGFTLIELISVLLVVGIMAAIAFPLFNRGAISVETDANAIEADLRMAQALAMSRETSTSVGITFTASSNSYTITDPSGTFSETRTLNDSTVSSGGTISFNRYGEPVSRPTIQITSSGQTKSITVEQYTGRVIIS